MAGIRIDALPVTGSPDADFEIAAMKDGLTVKLTVGQILGLASALIVGDAPEGLNTLDKLAAALGDDDDFATTIANALAGKQPMPIDGTFTPYVYGTSTAGVGTYSEQGGEYTLIGNRCFFSLTVNWSAHTGTGNMRIGGLPFAVSDRAAPFAVYATGLTFTGGTALTAFAGQGETFIYVRRYAESTSPTEIPMDTSALISVNGSYLIED